MICTSSELLLSVRLFWSLPVRDFPLLSAGLWTNDWALFTMSSPQQELGSSDLSAFTSLPEQTRHPQGGFLTSSLEDNGHTARTQSQMGHEGWQPWYQL